jgi:hypothetical protein
MTAPHYIVAASREYADRLARMVERGELRQPFLTRAEAERALANYPNGSGVTYRVYEVAKQSKAGDIAAAITLAILAIAVWLILPGEAHAAFKEPAHVARTWADDFAALVAVLIGFSGFCLALIAVVANKLRDKARDYYGENYDGE